MSGPARPITETRADQMFPTLEPAEVDRLRRFGEVRAFAAGDYLARTGEVGPGMLVILSGEVVISQRDDLAPHPPITVHGPGSFMGELAQLSDRPALVDAVARGAVEALVIPSRKLRNLMIEEAELGERIMRALILRRVGLLETGAGGPVIVGRANDGDVLRLEGFLARNGHPQQRLDPDTDPAAKALLERFQVDPLRLPIVLCPNGRLLRNPSENDLASCIGLTRPMDPSRVYDVVIVGAGPAGLAAAVYGASEGLSVLVLDCRAFGGQAGASARIENYLGFPTGISGMALMARAYNQAQKFGVEMAIPKEVVSLQDHPEGGRALSARPRQRRARRRAGRDRRQRRPIPAPQCGESRRLRGRFACTTGPRPWRPGYAPGRRSRWSARAIPPARRPSISRAKSPRSGCSCADPAWRRACRAIWSTASPRSPISRY